MKPTYHITVANSALLHNDTTTDSTLMELSVDLQMDRVSWAQFKLIPNGGIQANIGDPITIKLDEVLVFSGAVCRIDSGVNSLNIECECSLRDLVSRRINSIYQEQTAGDIANDLASKAGVTPGNIESGLQYPVYAIGEDRSLHKHLLDLARRNGYDVYADPNDQLVFAAYQGNTVHQFQYGVNILNFSLDTSGKRIDGVVIYGESPTSLGQGTEAYSWLTKQEVKGTAGKNQGQIAHLVDPALKNTEAVAGVAQQIFQRLSKAKAGKLTALGSATIQLGDGIQVSDMPDSSLDGAYKIVRIIHRLNKRKGFITKIYWEEL